MTFSDDVTTIKGRNGVGKSTIADAVSWLLFGKNAKGETSFGIKTRDEEGNEIPHLDHSVTLEILVDGKPHKLQRILKEKWSKPRGAEDEVLVGNTIKYYIDNEEQTKADYDKYVFSLAGVQLFPLLSTPSAFANLHWQDQRKMLAEMAGKVDMNDIINNVPRFAELTTELKEQSLEAYRKHLSYQIKELKNSINEMPVKVQTLKQTLSEATMGKEETEELLKSSQDKLADLNKQLLSAKAGGIDLAATKNIKDRIHFAETRILNIEISKRNLAKQEAEEHDARCRDFGNIFNDAKNTYNGLKQKRKSLEILIDRCSDHIKEVQSDLAIGTSDWKRMKEETFIFDQNLTICPTCGQELPVEQTQERYKDALNKFNLGKAARKEQLLAKAEKLNAELEQAKKEKEENISLLSVTDEQIQAAHVAMDEAEERYNTILKEPVPTAQDLLDADDNYKQIKASVEALYKELENPTEDNTDTTALEEDIANVQAECKKYEGELAAIQHNERIQNLINETKGQWQKLNKQLTILEQKEDVAIELSDKLDAVLEDSVNSRFQFVKFKLFRTLVDGKTKEPYCTATLNGVEYKDCSAAQKTNIGLDIINTLSEHFGTYVPVVVDNAEGICNIQPTKSQQIRLYVTNDNELIVS